MSLFVQKAAVLMELFSKAIEGNVDKLVNKIEVEGNGFWNKLKDRNVLTPAHAEICQNKV